MEFPTIDKFAKDVAEKALDEYVYDGKTIREWVEIIAKQEPCEDCISREAVEEMIKAEMPERGMWEIEGDKEKETVCEVCVDLMQKLSELPPVTPQQKTAHLINLEKTKYKGLVLPFWGRYECSECGNHGQYNFNFCPNCGARMTESEEEE